MSPLVSVLAIVLLCALILVVRLSVVLATRLDRLHWRILSTRDSLDVLLGRRASEARVLASAPYFSEDEAELLRMRAEEALAYETSPLAADGLDRRGEERTQSENPEEVAQRLAVEGTLSCTIRTLVTEERRSRIGEDSLWAQRLAALDETSYRVQLARSMHNLFVTQTRKLREKTWVKVAHLAGYAPVPAPIDFDDDTLKDGHGY